jgi:DNA-binding transcriptional LysR family regulator
MSDVAESVFFPALVRFCAIRAPGIRLEIIPLDVEEVARSLKLGEVDIAVGYLPALGSDFVSHDLFHDDLTCLLGEGHPPVEAGLSPGEFANLRHIDAGVNAPGHKMVDEMLHAMGIRRNVFVRTTRLSNAPPMLEKTDLAVIFPKILIRKFYRDAAFRQVEIPIELMPVEICAHYHCHYKNDSSILWMVEAISLIAADVNGS